MNNKTYFKNQSRKGTITAGIIGILSLFYLISCSADLDVTPLASTTEDTQAMLSSTNGVVGNPTPPDPIEHPYIIDYYVGYENGFIEKILSWYTPTNMGTIDGSTPATLTGHVVKYKTGDSDFIEIDENSEGVRLSSSISLDNHYEGVPRANTMISGLSPNTTYTFLVAASNSAGLVTPDADVATVTITTDPPSPLSFQVVSSTSSNVVLSWHYFDPYMRPLPNYPNNYPNNYYVSYKNPDDPVGQWGHSNSVEGTALTVNDLKPATKYAFALILGDKSISIRIEHTTPRENATLPSPVENLKHLEDPFAYQDTDGFPFVYQNGLIAHQLLWDAPNNMGTIDGTTPADLTGYVVKYKTEDSDFVEIDENSYGVRLTKRISANDNSTWISGLSLNTKYTFLVAAKNSGGAITPNADAVTVTTPPVLSPPMNLQTVSSTNSFTNSIVVLSWDPPSPHQSSDIAYGVGYKKAGDNDFTTLSAGTNTTATVTGLLPGTEYTFAVYTYDYQGKSITSPRVRIGHTTAGTSPPSPVERLAYYTDPFTRYQDSLPFVYQNGLIAHQLLWDAPNNMGIIDGTTPATLAGYVVKYKIAGDSDFIEIDENSERVRLTKTIGTNDNSIWISGLSVNTRYTFLVAAKNSAGAVTPDADATTVTTRPISLPPLDLQIVSSTDREVELSWTPPSPNYDYSIYYKVEGGNFKFFTTTRNTSARVTGLSPDTKYTLGVHSSGFGDTLWSPYVYIDHTTALEGSTPPSRVENLTYLKYPFNYQDKDGFPFVYQNGLIAHQLLWDAPTDKGTTDGTTPATLTGYVVKYKTEDSGFTEIDENSEGVRLTKTIGPSDLNTWISGLSLNTSYTFLVAAKNSGGAVTPDAATITTPPRAGSSHEASGNLLYR